MCRAWWIASQVIEIAGEVGGLLFQDGHPEGDIGRPPSEHSLKCRIHLGMGAVVGWLNRAGRTHIQSLHDLVAEALNWLPKYTIENVPDNMVRQTFYIPESMLQEIEEEAVRLDRSAAWVVVRAWILARDRIKEMPSLHADE